MTFKHILLSLLLTIIAFGACKKDEVTDPNPMPVAKAILPGVGSTEIKIGDAAQVAIDLFGPPFPSNASAGGMYTHYLVYASKGVVIYCVPVTEATFNAQMKIARLKFSAPYDGKTEKGIGVGSTKVEVKSAYGNPTSSSVSLGDAYAIGITFIYDSITEKVKSIEVK